MRAEAERDADRTIAKEIAASDLNAASWLIRVRWWLLVGQACALGNAMFSSMPPAPVLPIALLSIGVASNVGLAIVEKRFAPPAGAVLLLDTLLITVLLFSTGGPMNPFTALYFVLITMAAVLLGTRWVVGILSLSLLGYAALFFLADPHAHHRMDFASHLQGMWIAFGVAATLITVFVTRLTSERTARRRDLERERDRASRSAQVAALTSLAAGAAHELGTPIGTMLIAAGELERTLAGLDVPKEVRDDVRLIRAEGLRCRAVLEGLSEAGGEARGESFRRVTLREVIDRAFERLGDARARVRVEGDTDEEAELPVGALSLALQNLALNALDASAPDGVVRVILSTADDNVTLSVHDTGIGMSPAVLERADEPFFTTKSSGGMGLGLFLVRALAEQLGGELRIESELGVRTVATLSVPRSPTVRPA